MKLAEALTDSPVVVLTGAGASAPLGLCTTRDLLDRISEKFEVMPDPLDRAMGEGRLQITRERDGDVESLLFMIEGSGQWSDYLSNDQWFVSAVADHDRDKVIAFRDANTRLRDVIRAEIIEHYSEVDPTRAAELYRHLLLEWTDVLRHAVGGRTTIPFFTLNYDVAVEVACDSLSLRLVDGFDGGRPGSGRRWSIDAYRDFEETDEGTVVLVKLHGSVSLGGQDDSDELFELPRGVGKDPGKFRHVVIYPAALPKPVYSDEPFRSCYRVLRRCLEKAVVLLVIGCSLRDDELNWLLRDVMDDNDRLHLMTLAPEADYQTISERIGIDPRRVVGVCGRFEADDGDFLQRLVPWIVSAQGGVGGERSRVFGVNVSLDQL